MELFSLVIGYLFAGTMLFCLCLPLIVCFLECWKRTLLMLGMIALSGFFAIGVAVFFNAFAGIVFAGGMTGLIIGVVWEKHDTSVFA